VTDRLKVEVEVELELELELELEVDRTSIQFTTVQYCYYCVLNLCSNNTLSSTMLYPEQH
jgi:hypothetical protein